MNHKIILLVRHNPDDVQPTHAVRPLEPHRLLLNEPRPTKGNVL